MDCPEPNGSLPYAPDKGDYHVHELSVEDGELVVTLNAPDSLSSDTLHASEHGYTLDVPVALPAQETDTVVDCVLAVDLGVKKQATAVPVEHGADTHQQVAPPQFLDHGAVAWSLSSWRDVGGLHHHHGRNRGQRRPNGSITRYVLASTTECA